MYSTDHKSVLRRYFDIAHDVLLWKLDGVSEYDVRRPLTPTGTNLLGVLQHVAVVELGYFGEVFGRPHGVALPWDGREELPNEDMYASADQTRQDVLDLFARARAHSLEVIDELDLDTTGTVPWWGDHGDVTLHRVLVHMIAELHRHTGQIDILREGLDGAVGWNDGNDNLADGDAEFRRSYVAQLEQIARAASAPGT